MNEELFKDLVRPVTEEDRKKLPVFSYSKIDTYRNCPYQYDLKYNQKKFTDDTSIALELGGLLHYVLEQKGNMLVRSTGSLFEQPFVNYDLLNEIMINGVTKTDEKTREYLLGINDLKKKYFETWYEKDNASGMTYEDKMQIFDKVLHSEMEWTEENGFWRPYLFEHPFEFVWNNRVIIKGFIDRIDMKADEYNIHSVDFRTIDYKTSKKIYDSNKLATSLQFGIYALAILNEFGKLPVENMYRFILLDDRQYALTKGWEKRLIKALDGIFDKIDSDNTSGIWTPKPTPLCYWCNFCSHNPDATEYKHDCEYYSMYELNSGNIVLSIKSDNVLLGFRVNRIKLFYSDKVNSEKFEDAAMEDL